MARRKKQPNNQKIKKSAEKLIKERARNIPLAKCYISSNWEEFNMAHLIVSRKHINGNVTYSMILVDLVLYGVKECYYRFNVFTDELDEIIRDNSIKLKEVSYEFAHNIVFAGLEWADNFGFLPHKNWSVAKYILEEDSESIPLIDIDCGIDGRPTIFEYSAIAFKSDIQQLNETVGEGNYDIIYEEEDDDDYLERLNDDFVGTVIDTDIDEYCPEFFDEDYDIVNEIDFDHEDSIPIKACIINKAYNANIGSEKFESLDLMDYAIGDIDIKDDSLESNKEEYKLVEELNRGQEFPSEESIISAIKKFPDSNELFKMLYDIDYINEEPSLANSERIYNILDDNLIALGNYLSFLAMDKDSKRFKKILRETDFYNRVLNSNGDMPSLLFVYFCIVKAFDFSKQDNLEEADLYYFAARIFSDIFENYVISSLTISLMFHKIEKIEESPEPSNLKSPLKVVHSKKDNNN